MTLLMTLLAVDWLALLQVAVVTILAAVGISALMSLSNWALTPVDGLEHQTRPRLLLGYVCIGMMVLIVLGGLYLIIPYFRH